MNPEELDKIISEAKSKLEELQNSHQSLSSKVTEADRLLNELKLKAGENQEFINAIQGVKEAFETKKQEAEGSLQALQQKIGEAEKFLSDTFTPLRDQINNPETGLQSNINKVQESSSAIKNYEEQCKTHLENINQSVDEYNASLEKLKETEKAILDSLEETKTKADGNLDSVEDMKLALEKIFSNIEAKEKEVVETETKAKATNERIDQLKSESEGIRHKINFIYEQATNDTMSGAFQKQAAALKTELDEWYNKIWKTSLGLCILIVAIFVFQLWVNDWSLQKLDAGFYLRFTFTAPVIFYLTFCTRQYANIRKAWEKYTFKSVMALSIPHHNELLLTNFEDEKTKRVDFSLAVLNKIYDEPYYDENMKMRHKIKVDEIKYSVAPDKFDPKTKLNGSTQTTASETIGK